MISCLIFCLLSYQGSEAAQVIHIEEEVVTAIPETPEQRSKRNVYIGDSVIRTDFEDYPDLRLLYDLRLGTLIVVEMDKKTFYLSRPGRKKRLLRSMLNGFTRLDDGVLTTDGPLVKATGAKRIISGEECFEYKLNYSNKGMETNIWVTRSRISTDRRDFRKIWHAATGTIPPLDVKAIYTRLFSELKGVPVSVEHLVHQEGITILTVTTITHINRRFKAPEGFFSIPENFEISQVEPDQERPWP